MCQGKDTQHCYFTMWPVLERRKGGATTKDRDGDGGGGRRKQGRGPTYTFHLLRVLLLLLLLELAHPLTHLPIRPPVPLHGSGLFFPLLPTTCFPPMLSSSPSSSSPCSRISWQGNPLSKIVVDKNILPLPFSFHVYTQLYN